MKRDRFPEFPAEHEFKTVIVSNQENPPTDMPTCPKPVYTLAATLERSGWCTRVGFSRAWRRGQRTGTFRRAEFFGLYAFGHPDSRHRIVSIYWRFADKAETFAWFRDTMKLELAEKPAGAPGGWTWQDGRIVHGFSRHRVKVTDIQEFAQVRGSVTPGWFDGIARRFAEQAAKALCGKGEDHTPHMWETATGTAKSCSGKATKPKEADTA